MPADITGAIYAGNPPLPQNGLTVSLWTTAQVPQLPAEGTAPPSGSPYMTATTGGSAGADGQFVFKNVPAGRYYLSWVASGTTLWAEAYAIPVFPGMDQWAVNAAGGLSVGTTTDQLAGAAGLWTGGPLTAATVAVTGSGAALSVTNNASIGGTLAVAGATTLAGLTAQSVAVTGTGTALTVTNNASIGGTLAVTGATALAGLTAQSVAVTGTGTALSVTNSASVGGALSVTGALGVGAAAPAGVQGYVKSATTGTVALVADSPTGQTADLIDARVNGTTVFAVAPSGAVAAGAGSFASLAVNGTLPSSTQAYVKAGGVGVLPLVVDAPTSQTANLQEWRVNGTRVAWLDPSGNLTLAGALAAQSESAPNLVATGQLAVGQSALVSGVQAAVAATAAANVGLRVVGASGQTGDLIQAQTSSGTALWRVGATGQAQLQPQNLAGAAGLAVAASGTGSASTPTQGAQLQLAASPSASVGHLRGVEADVLVGPTSSGVTVSTASALWAQASITGSSPAGTIQQLRGLYVAPPASLASGTPAVTAQNVVGVYIDNQSPTLSGITLQNPVALSIAAQSSGYAIYSAGGQHYLKGGSTSLQPLVVDSPSGLTANLQEWRVNGVAQAYVTNAGGAVLAGPLQAPSAQLTGTGTALSVTNAASIGGTLSVTGASTITIPSGQALVAKTTADTTGYTAALQGIETAAHASQAGYAVGVEGDAVYTGTGGAQLLAGLRAALTPLSGSSATGTLGAASGLDVATPVSSGAGSNTVTVTQLAGVRVRDQGASLTGVTQTNPAAALYVDPQSNNAYGLYVAGAPSYIKSNATSQRPLVVDSPSGQTANLQEWRVNGSTVAAITPSGQFTGSIAFPYPSLQTTGASFSSGSLSYNTYGGVGAGTTYTIYNSSFLPAGSWLVSVVINYTSYNGTSGPDVNDYFYVTAPSGIYYSLVNGYSNTYISRQATIVFISYFNGGQNFSVTLYLGSSSLSVYVYTGTNACYWTAVRIG